MLYWILKWSKSKKWTGAWYKIQFKDLLFSTLDYAFVKETRFILKSPHEHSIFFHISRLMRRIEQNRIHKNFGDLTHLACLAVRHYNRHTRIFSVLVWGCNWIKSNAWVIVSISSNSFGRLISSFKKNLEWGHINFNGNLDSALVDPKRCQERPLGPKFFHLYAIFSIFWINNLLVHPVCWLALPSTTSKILDPSPYCCINIRIKKLL